jgi:hypothetical protein
MHDDLGRTSLEFSLKSYPLNTSFTGVVLKILVFAVLVDYEIMKTEIVRGTRG